MKPKATGSDLQDSLFKVRLRDVVNPDYQPHRHIKRNSVFSKSWYVIIVILNLICGDSVEAELQKSGNFRGHWSVTGTVQTINFDSSRTVSTFRIGGGITVLSGNGDPPRGMRSDCIGFFDSETGGVGRCVLIDSDRDRIFSEFSGFPLVADRKNQGRFVGGTGKYQGLQGEYEFAWDYMLPNRQAGTVHGFASNLTGSWRLP